MDRLEPLQQKCQLRPLQRQGDRRPSQKSPRSAESSPLARSELASQKLTRFHMTYHSKCSYSGSYRSLASCLWLAIPASYKNVQSPSISARHLQQHPQILLTIQPWIRLLCLLLRCLLRGHWVSNSPCMYICQILLKWMRSLAIQIFQVSSGTI